MSFKENLILNFCRLGPAGLSLIMPGTCGTFVGLILSPILFIPLSLPLKLLVLVLVFWIGSIASTQAEIILKEKDSSQIVIDELLGMWITLLPLTQIDLPWMLSSFVCFRFFDMLKPWPIRQSESWFPGGYSVMFDDALAGFISLLVLRGIYFVFL